MIQNSPLVSSVESIAHIVIGLSPSRVRDSEVRSEAVYTAINLLSLYHERIRAKHGLVKARGTSLAILLRAVQTVEVLLEMAAISVTGGSSRKWLLVMAVEVFKSLLRLGMFRERGCKMVLEPDGVDLSSLGSASPLGHNKGNELQANRFAGRRSGRMLRSVREPQALITSAASQTLSARMLTAEILHIARPVVYLMSYLQCSERSWVPCLLSAAMDACSMRLHAAAMSADERNEITRRQCLLFFYCVRTPIYESISRPVYLFFFNRLWRHIPVIREIAETFMGLFDGLHSLHFYKAGS